jgi:hypothetical protein
MTNHLPLHPNGVIGVRDQPPSVVNGTLQGSGGKKANALRANALSVPLINLGTSSE